MLGRPSVFQFPIESRFTLFPQRTNQILRTCSTLIATLITFFLISFRLQSYPKSDDYPPPVPPSLTSLSLLCLYPQDHSKSKNYPVPISACCYLLLFPSLHTPTGLSKARGLPASSTAVTSENSSRKDQTPSPLRRALPVNGQPKCEPLEGGGGGPGGGEERGGRRRDMGGGADDER